MPSRAAEGIFLKERFFTKTKREVIPYCIDAQPAPAPRERLNGNFNILYVGQLIEHKGVHLLIKAFRELPYQKMRLHIVGGGDYAPRLKGSAGADTRITFYGKVDNAGVFRFYRFADVTVVPSLWPEFLGIVILESFSMSTPVISSAVGGITEIVRDGYNGFLFKPDEPAELKNILEKVFLDSSILESLRNNAWRTSCDFDCSSHLRRLKGAYRAILPNNADIRG